MIETPDFREWVGDEVRSSSGDKIGTLEDVYFDADAGEPGRAYLMVAFHDEELKQAPTLESGTDLTSADEERIYRYYKMDYQHHSSGRRLVRR